MNARNKILTLINLGLTLLSLSPGRIQAAVVIPNSENTFTLDANVTKHIPTSLCIDLKINLQKLIDGKSEKTSIPMCFSFESLVDKGGLGACFDSHYSLTKCNTDQVEYIGIPLSKRLIEVSTPGYKFNLKASTYKLTDNTGLQGSFANHFLLLNFKNDFQRGSLKLSTNWDFRMNKILANNKLPVDIGILLLPSMPFKLAPEDNQLALTIEFEIKGFAGKTRPTPLVSTITNLRSLNAVGFDLDNNEFDIEISL